MPGIKRSTLRAKPTNKFHGKAKTTGVRMSEEVKKAAKVK